MWELLDSRKNLRIDVMAYRAKFGALSNSMDVENGVQNYLTLKLFPRMGYSKSNHVLTVFYFIKRIQSKYVHNFRS